MAQESAQFSSRLLCFTEETNGQNRAEGNRREDPEIQSSKRMPG